MAGVKQLAHRRERRLAHEKTRRRIALGILADELVLGARAVDPRAPAESPVTYAAGAGLALRASIGERLASG